MGCRTRSHGESGAGRMMNASGVNLGKLDRLIATESTKAEKHAWHFFHLSLWDRDRLRHR
jgi:hypothetical protein